MADDVVAARELIARQYIPGVRVTNCVVHAGLSIIERPRDCDLCRTDLENAFRHAQTVNEWLNRWRDDATAVLTRQDAALLDLNGWETRQRGAGDDFHNDVFPMVDVVRGDEVLVRQLPEASGEQLVEFLNRAVERADGLVPAVDVEGGADGSRPAGT